MAADILLDSGILIRHPRKNVGYIPLTDQLAKEHSLFISYLLNNLGEDGGCAGGFAARTPPAPLIIEMILHISVYALRSFTRFAKA